MKKSLIAGAGIAALGLAVVPFAGVNSETTDNIQVTVSESCTFSAGGTGTTATGTLSPGQETTFNDNGTHKFTVKCNSKSYIVTAVASDLAYDGTAPTTHGIISYVDSASYQKTGTDGNWTATLTSGDADAKISKTSSTIKSATAATAGDSFSVAYKAYAGTAQTTGTYKGTVTYTLTGSNK